MHKTGNFGQNSRPQKFGQQRHHSASDQLKSKLKNEVNGQSQSVQGRRDDSRDEGLPGQTITNLQTSEAADNLTQQSKQLLPRRIAMIKNRRVEYNEMPQGVKLLNPNHSRTFGKISTAADEEEKDGGAHAEESSSSKPASPQYYSTSGQEIDKDDPIYNDPDIILAQYRPIMKWKKQAAASIGLNNVGNTCFANSILQSLSFCPPLAHFLMDYKPSGRMRNSSNDLSKQGYNPLDSLSGVVKTLHGAHATKVRSFSPLVIVRSLRFFNRQMRLGEQHDCQEFATALLDACQNFQLKELFNSGKVDLHSQQTTPLQHVIGGYLRSSVIWDAREEVMELKKKKDTAFAHVLELAKRGSERKFYSNTYDPCSMIHLPLAGGSIKDCFTAFCKPEQLPRKIYKTPRNVQVDAIKRFSIHVPPKVLILHLKRFDNRHRKMSKNISFEERLDIAPFVSDGRMKKCPYTLCAVSVHHGRSMTFGHYIAFVRAANGMWYCCDDESVRQVNIQQVLRQEAYMLWYTQQEDAVVMKETSEFGSPLKNKKTFAAPATTVMIEKKEDVGSALSEDQVAAMRASQAKKAAEATKREEEGRKSGQQSPRVIPSHLSPQHKPSPALAGLKKQMSPIQGSSSVKISQKEDQGVSDTLQLPPSTSRVLGPNQTTLAGSKRSPQKRANKLDARLIHPTDKEEEDSDSDSDDVMETESDADGAHQPPSKRQRTETHKNPDAAPSTSQKQQQDSNGESEELPVQSAEATATVVAASKKLLVGAGAGRHLAQRTKAHQDVGPLRMDESSGKFVQRQRDAEWDAEMDKPREKRRKRDREDGEEDDEDENGEKVNEFWKNTDNKFQKVATARTTGEQVPEVKRGEQRKQERKQRQKHESYMQNLKCFNCDGFGHKREDCPRPPQQRTGRGGFGSHFGGGSRGGRGGGARGGRGHERGRGGFSRGGGFPGNRR